MNVVRTKYTGVGCVLVTVLYELLLSSIDMCIVLMHWEGLEGDAGVMSGWCYVLYCCVLGEYSYDSKIDLNVVLWITSEEC